MFEGALYIFGSDAEKCHKFCETLETGYTTLANFLTVYQKSGHGVKRENSSLLGEFLWSLLLSPTVYIKY